MASRLVKIEHTCKKKDQQHQPAYLQDLVSYTRRKTTANIDIKRVAIHSSEQIKMK